MFRVTSILTNKINNFHNQPDSRMLYFSQEKQLISGAERVNQRRGFERTPFRGAAWAGGPAMISGYK